MPSRTGIPNPSLARGGLRPRQAIHAGGANCHSGVWFNCLDQSPFFSPDRAPGKGTHGIDCTLVVAQGPVTTAAYVDPLTLRIAPRHMFARRQEPQVNFPRGIAIYAAVMRALVFAAIAALLTASS